MFIPEFLFIYSEYLVVYNLDSLTFNVPVKFQLENLQCVWLLLFGKSEVNKLRAMTVK